MTRTATRAREQGLLYVPQLAVDLDTRSIEALPALSFPAAEMVKAAAALFDGPKWGPGWGTSWIGPEGRSFEIVVSAGTVGVVMRDPARFERNAKNALGHETRGTAQVFAPLPDEYDGVIYANDDGPSVWREPKDDRVIIGWSQRSRSRMVQRLAQLDWSPMYVSGRPSVMLTLTYPGDWYTVAPSGKAVKKHLDKFRKRYERKWGCKMIYAWKLEFQRRGAPHLHLLIVPPAVDLNAYRAWVSQAWAAVVAHPDPEQYRRHVLAGTAVDAPQGKRCFDPKRAAVYFAKHGGAGGGKEYQHVVPVEWQEPGQGPGRFWGYVGLTLATAAAPIPMSAHVQIKRTLRRWSRSQGMTARLTVPRGANATTGVVGTRKVSRRRVYLAHSGLQGGTVLVNNGPSFASALARMEVAS